MAVLTNWDSYLILSFNCTLFPSSLRQAPQEEKEILQDVLNEGCNTCPSHSQSSAIHQPTCFSADLLEHHDNEDNDKEESLYFSLNSEFQEGEENDLQLDEKYFQYSGHLNSCDTEELVISSVFPSHEPKVSSTVDGTKLNLDTCIELQTLTKLEGDALGGLAVKTPGCELHVLTDTMSVMKQKIMKRKQLFCKWRMACRFPGLQASGRVVTASVALGCTYLFSSLYEDVAPSAVISLHHWFFPTADGDCLVLCLYFMVSHPERLFHLHLLFAFRNLLCSYICCPDIPCN
ncbi:uncharacterized protein LOC144368650 [Ictidomys tridecemlineatus]